MLTVDQRLPRLGVATTQVLIALTLLSVIAAARLAWPFTVDDAFIVAAYARQLSTGGGYSLDGTSVSDGVTSPLWLLPAIAARAFGFSSVVAAKLIGLLCAVCGLLLVLRRLAARQGSSILVLGAGLLCACQADLSIWSVGGLETGAATLALCGATVAASTHRPRVANQLWLGLSLASLSWLRPELVPTALPLLYCAWIRTRDRRWIAPLLASLGTLAVVAFRWVMFGHLLPLSALAKPAELANGLRYVVGGGLLITGVVGVVLFARGLLVGRAIDRWVALVVVVALASIMLAGGDWMPGFRLLVPVIPLYAWVAAVGAATMRRRWVGIALVAASCVLPAVSLTLQLPRARASGGDRDRSGAALASWLHTHACHVALVDVGYLAYAADLRVFDLAGITDVTVAALPGGHVGKRIPYALVADRDPDTLILRARRWRSIDDGRLPTAVDWHSRTERDLAESAEVARRYRPVHVTRYADGYVYYVLQRERAQSCPKR